MAGTKPGHDGKGWFHPGRGPTRRHACVMVWIAIAAKRLCNTVQ
jgi:hypothetical protein